MKKTKQIENTNTLQTSGKSPEVLLKDKNSSFKQLTLEESLNENDSTIDVEKEKNESAPGATTTPETFEAVKKNNLKNQKTQELEPVSETEKEELEKVEEAVKSQKSKKKKWTSFLGLIINLLVVGGLLTYQLLTEKGEVASFSELVSNIDWGIFMLVILCYVVFFFLETSKIWLLIFKTHKKNRPALAFKTAVIGRYYDSITPMATGGQPFQIYYMTKRGVSGSDALSVTMGKYVLQQVAYVIFSLAVLIYSVVSANATASTGATVVTATSWIGFGISAAIVFLVTLVSINKTLGYKLVSGCLKLLHKMKIVKNYDQQFKKVQKTVGDFQSTMKHYATKDPLTFVSSLIINFAYYLVRYCLPFLIYASFYGFNFAVFGEIFVYCVMVDLSASFFPLPGGTGASELSFTVLFGKLFGVGGNLFWAMLIWRIFTYYIYILQGIGVMIYDSVCGNKKLEWQKRKWALEQESREFEAKELKDFELSLEKKSKKEKRKWF